LRHQERQDFCHEDFNTHELLLSQSYGKLRGVGSEKNVRALANLVSRFFLPLLSQLGLTSTEELLQQKYSEYLFQALVEIGGIEDFFDDPDAYADALKNKTVGFHLFFLYTPLVKLSIVLPTERGFERAEH
jgi:hypothetical protein